MGRGEVVRKRKGWRVKKWSRVSLIGMWMADKGAEWR